MVICPWKDQSAYMSVIKSVDGNMRKITGSNSSELSLINRGDQRQEVDSSVSHNSMCKLKIDLMFNDNGR